ncbi:uncharacterized protein LOC127789040 isoform X2 [Diospyros lotus]|uniref:uncharacterized protein LOC127789040 isoform X2 n=1 Tax=Diospyros lotus TaxID=55363 RepID=UPI0022506D3E|nr:uncharacterized protein LOC127789040 isoform X2 [Diospyros lotus]
MDLETENRIAAILMKEAVELRQQAEKEGVHAYLRKPQVRGRPNSRFLTATVLGVQQANRVVEVNEMWRVRQKELQLDNRLKGRSEDDSSTGGTYRDMNDSQRATSIKTSAGASHSSSKRAMQDCHSRDDGLKDEDIEEFLQSRVKRGRGSVGSRMDETGPYIPPSPDSRAKHLANHDGGSSGVSEHHIRLGPKKPSYLKSHASPEKESVEGEWKEEKKVGSSKKHLRKHRSKDKSRDKKMKKKKREEKRYRHRKDL